ncbi:hypothetical protein B0J13DRAFT_133829 [Dactylonectria estremocensis]|uniref:Uncharacterized protein n=1 Tax=Dactylonectria estremocensis TaxID=1079267 RepID=A0A9P9IT11_9HYPO|nr:hypothetical protein B0J13DRAFT_133829 [Dactylonectria estremocensis]
MTQQSTERASFFTLPIEIRNTIWTDVWAPRLQLHIFFKEDRLMTAPCLGAQTGDETSALDDSRGIEPKNHRMPSAEEKKLSRRLHRRYSIECLKSRLHSPWGNHYRCEEDWNPMPGHISTEKNSCINFLLVNKMMYAECMHFISQHLDVTITDLRTAASLVENVGSTSSDEPQHMIPLHLLRSSRFFNIVLFGSPELLIALALNSDDSISSHPLKHQSHCAIGVSLVIDWDLVENLLPQRQEWNKIWLGLAALPYISRVTFWVDHSACSSWTVINERALLEPLSRAKWPLNAEVLVHLPDISSHSMRSNKQFVGDIDHDTGLPFRICRRIRCPDRSPDRSAHRCPEEDLTIWILHDVSEQEQAQFDGFGMYWELDRMTTDACCWDPPIPR